MFQLHLGSNENQAETHLSPFLESSQYLWYLRTVCGRPMREAWADFRHEQKLAYFKYYWSQNLSDPYRRQ